MRNSPNNQISIHALLAESDGRPKRLKSRLCVFLSTLSLRRATLGLPATSLAHRDFYPRSPCGERLSFSVVRYKPIPISIHALLAESDRPTLYPLHRQQHFYPRSPCGERLRVYVSYNMYNVSFLSTLSLRRATRNSQNIKRRHKISIHALLAESDYHQILLQHSANYFYPRSPCGERQHLLII